MSCSNARRTTTVTLEGPKDPARSLKITLRKGSTFNANSSSSQPTFATPKLPRSQSSMDDVVDANRRRMALTLDDIEEALAKTANLTISDSPSTKKALRDTSIPVPRGFLDLPNVDPAMERRVLRPRPAGRSKQQLSDSGIGSSVASTNDSKSVTGTSAKAAKAYKAKMSTSGITRSAASSTKELLPSLGPKAVSRIHEYTIRPLLAKPTLKDFESIVSDVPRRISAKEIICLRDLEKTLLFMAPEKAKTAALYLDFCLTSIRCLQATVEFLSEREQVRPSDRPYTNGYFLDLKEQIYQYGQQLAAVKEKGTLDTVKDIDQADEVKLYGGVAENGRPAELVRVKKDGTMISLATGEVIDEGEAPATFKRSLSEQREDEEEIMRSMARRKKNATPEELAPKRCREPGCTKEFKRPCDLTKHEKTHSRPWKCPIPTCKYHEFGWPTEKEMDRHVNDKHSDKPAMYECLYKPCPYKSKRESNCKQHMEKAHGWTYVRTKTNVKKVPSQPASTAQQTPPLVGDASTPSTINSWSVPTPPQDHQPHMMDTDFPLYPNNSDWFATYGFQPDSIDNIELTLDHTSPSSANSIDPLTPYQNGPGFIIDEDIYAAPVHLPQGPMFEQMYQKMMMQQMAPVQVPPVSAPQQFSSNTHDTGLYSPNSLHSVEDTFDETFATQDTSDFQLYSSTLAKNNNFQPMMSEVPSANLGFSQTTQPDILQHIDWSNMDCHSFPE